MSQSKLHTWAARRRSEMTGSLWVWPAVASVAAVVLGAAVSKLDVSNVQPLRPWLYAGDATDARRLLLSLATAIVGTLALVIGLTTVAIQVAANRYSPRLLRSFLRDPAVKVTLSLFIGSFVFNAAGLFTVGQNGPDDYPRLAVTMGIISLFVCIGALIVFVDRMAHSIQIDTVLARIGESTLRAIERVPPGVGPGCGTVTLATPQAWAQELIADRAGYLQRVRRHELSDIAARGFNVRVAVRVGDHVVPGVTLGWIWPNTPGSSALVPLDDFRTALWIGQERTRNQDMALGIDQMVDIALLSTHVYDFHTVVQATHELTALLTRLATVDLGDEQQQVGDCTIGLRGRLFAEYLERACGELRRRALAEPVIFLAILGMLNRLTIATDHDNVHGPIHEETQLLLATAERAISEPAELERITRAAEPMLQFRS